MQVTIHLLLLSTRSACSYRFKSLTVTGIINAGIFLFGEQLKMLNFAKVMLSMFVNQSTCKVILGYYCTHFTTVSRSE
jgi:hypothetical protein